MYPLLYVVIIVTSLPLHHLIRSPALNADALIMTYSLTALSSRRTKAKMTPKLTVKTKLLQRIPKSKTDEVTLLACIHATLCVMSQ